MASTGTTREHVLLEPKVLRCSQRSARTVFKEGGSVLDLARRLAYGEALPNQVRTARIVLVAGIAFTLDHRRTVAFQLAASLRPDLRIPVTVMRRFKNFSSFSRSDIFRRSAKKFSNRWAGLVIRFGDDWFSPVEIPTETRRFFCVVRNPGPRLVIMSTIAASTAMMPGCGADDDVGI